LKRPSFQSLQSVVGLLAGLTSIGSVSYSTLRYLRPETPPGEMAAVVRDAGSERPLRGATIEILTPAGALVSALPAADDGSARRALPEGAYQLRATHPQFVGDTRFVRVVHGQTAEVQFRLARVDAGSRRSRGSAVDEAGRVVSRSVGAAQRFFHGLGL
jgi:hypothetical protein